MTSDILTPARRDLLKAATIAFPAVLTGAPDSKPIRVGLVGCGGRGTGAAAQAMKADDYAELVSVADVSQEQIDGALERLKKVAGPKIKVEKANQFVGLDAFERLLKSNVDVVLLATPPGFRPGHLRACIDAGKHVFCEKPVAVDAPGVRSVLESAKLASEKKLALVAGFCWRYANQIKDTVSRVKGGDIGDVVAYYATYYTSPVKPMPPAADRPAGMSDIEWQVRNWYNFSWLSGDGLVEQAVHSVDKIAWLMNDAPPESCVATGGRQIPAHGGNIFDHFQINWVYPKGVRAFLGCRQIPGCHNENSDYILGAKGQALLGRGPNPRIEGASAWQFQGQKYDMYQAEHDALFASIRKGQPINDGVWMTTSTMLAIMGRMAAYTGQQITWDQALNSQKRLGPDPVDWKGSFTPDPMPLPGVTKFV